MNAKMTWLRMIFSIVALLLGFLVAPGNSIEVGEQIPEFSIHTFDGQRVDRAALGGKPALLVFWNTWCDNCRRELPEINRKASVYGPEGLVILAINTSINDSEKAARDYWKEQQFVFPSAFDNDFELGQSFGVRGVPSIYLVDAKGIVLYKQAVAPEDLGRRLNQLSP